MFAVIFEVEPKQERFDDYLRHAKLLRPEIERIDGFILNERFESTSAPGRLLSLSFWRDEKALVRWRTLARHHEVQRDGRLEIFRDYHLRVGEVTYDSGAAELPQVRFDETQTGAARALTIDEMPERDAAAALARQTAPGTGCVEAERYDGLNASGRSIVMTAWRDARAAAAAPRPDASGVHRRTVRVIRDYGMHDRREAPQFYPPVPR